MGCRAAQAAFFPFLPPPAKCVDSVGLARIMPEFRGLEEKLLDCPAIDPVHGGLGPGMRCALGSGQIKARRTWLLPKGR